MQVIFLHHSCFLVELDEKVLIFDWFDGDKVDGFHFSGKLPLYEPDTPIYVFASHGHRDHFDMDVLKMAEYYTDIHFIFAKDCKMSPNFLKKHGYSPDIREKITYVSYGTKYQVADLEIETFRSTDAGVAFYVECKGKSLFHAGDLSVWKWEGVSDIINGMMEANYKTQMKRLAGKKVNVAFIPMDPRLEESQFLGMDGFIKYVDADYIFPMHMWQDYSGIATYKKNLTDSAVVKRIMDVSYENQNFLIQAG